MDVINFSGGGPETDPVNDAMIEAIAQRGRAGVVPVIAAGNDRDDFGLGSVGSPGTAPDAITVAAVSNTPRLRPRAHASSPRRSGPPADPVRARPPAAAPAAWATPTRRSSTSARSSGTNGKPVDRHLCGPARDPNGPSDDAARRARCKGAIALVSRGICTFASKATARTAAGAIGLVLVDNRRRRAEPDPGRAAASRPG